MSKKELKETILGRTREHTATWILHAAAWGALLPKFKGQHVATCQGRAKKENSRHAAAWQIHAEVFVTRVKKTPIVILLCSYKKEVIDI